MVFGEKDGKKTAVAGMSRETIVRRPIEHLGVTLKSMVTRAELEGAKGLYIFVPLEDGDD